MRRYRLEGYNSGGYHAFREVDFPGGIRLVRRYDAATGSVERYIEVTEPGGEVRREDNAFLQRLLDEQSYVESFLTTGIEEIPAVGVGEKRELRFRDGRALLLRFLYPTRYALFFPLAYCVVWWMAGNAPLACPVLPILVPFLLLYVFLYLSRFREEGYSPIALVWHLMLIVSYGMLLREGGRRETDLSEIWAGVFLGTFGIHLSYWIGSLLPPHKEP
jgi:hypothetical protein